ncbi:MAG: hypothetical protein IKS56_03880 [Lachnospiraceae bacterium]|nr:hypothetical protein [Lachnospiraceae bacterium]
MMRTDAGQTLRYEFCSKKLHKNGNEQNIVPRSVRACVGITTSIIHIRFLLVFFIKQLVLFAPHFN